MYLPRTPECPDRAPRFRLPRVAVKAGFSEAGKVRDEWYINAKRTPHPQFTFGARGLSRKNKMIVFSIILFIILDRFFKSLSSNHYFDQPIYILKDIFSLNFIGNYNIAFSLPITGIFLNIIIMIIILGLIFSLLHLRRQGRDMEAIFLFAVILGAISNLIDRLKYGYVIDYFDLKYFTVFNLADAMIVGGILGLLWLIVKENKRQLN